MRITLTAVLFAMIATALMGIGITAVLSMPGYTTQMLIIAAGIGFVLAGPVAWFVSVAILKNIKN